MTPLPQNAAPRPGAHGPRGPVGGSVSPDALTSSLKLTGAAPDVAPAFSCCFGGRRSGVFHRCRHAAAGASPVLVTRRMRTPSCRSSARPASPSKAANTIPAFPPEAWHCGGRRSPAQPVAPRQSSRFHLQRGSVGELL